MLAPPGRARGEPALGEVVAVEGSSRQARAERPARLPAGGARVECLPAPLQSPRIERIVVCPQRQPWAVAVWQPACKCISNKESIFL